MDFWARFSGKADPADLIGIRRGLLDRIGAHDADVVTDYLIAMIDALWIGADTTAVPDPWEMAGLPPLHHGLPAKHRTG